jgi:hypothetical protein
VLVALLAWTATTDEQAGARPREGARV